MILENVVVPTETRVEVLKAIMDGCTVRDACICAGVSDALLRRWQLSAKMGKSRDLVDFFDACELAKAQVRRRLVSNLLVIATGKSEAEPSAQGQQIKAINRLLSAYDRETWCPSFGDGYKRATAEVLQAVRATVPKEEYRKVLAEVAGE